MYESRVLRVVGHEVDAGRSLRLRRRWYADETPSEETEEEQQPSESSSKTYDEKYVRELRDEAANWRRKLRDNEKAMEELQAQFKDLSKSQKEREEKELQDQQQWQQLAEKRQKELDALQRQIADKDRAMLRLRIANEFGLMVPLDEDGGETLADRLRGDTEEELRADAAKLAVLAKALKGDSTPDEQPAEQPAARRPSTTAVPGGKPVGRTDADRKAEYFQFQNESPIFQKGGLILPAGLED